MTAEKLLAAAREAQNRRDFTTSAGYVTLAVRKLGHPELLVDDADVIGGLVSPEAFVARRLLADEAGG